MKTLLLAALVVLAALGIWMYSKHARQQEFALRNLEIQQKVLRHRDRIDALCRDDEKATFEKSSPADLDATIKDMQGTLSKLDAVAPLIKQPELHRLVNCELEYRALIDDKAREEQLRKEYGQ